jgi:hypothetical protein
MTHDDGNSDATGRPCDCAPGRHRTEDVITFGAPVPLLVVALAHYTDDDGQVVMLRDTVWGWAVMGLLVAVLGVVFVIRMRRLHRAVRAAKPGGTAREEDF